MAKKDPRVDAYIERSAPFARPILTRLRRLVHRGCPEVVENIKWGMPHFEYKGLFCGMAAFQEHCTFGFWNREMNLGRSGDAMGQFGRIASKADLPPASVLLGHVREAKRLADAGRKAGPVRRKRAPLPVPPALAAALRTNAAARKNFEGFSASGRREYCEWIGEAKTDATRDRRVATAVGWIAEGKPRNWKYMRPARKKA